MIALPSYIDPMLWAAFVEQRKAMKVPFTQQAQKLVVMKLMKMHAEGWDCNASLEKSAIYGYRSVFEVAKRETPKEDKDPALAKLERDAKIPKGIPAELKDTIAKLTRKATA